MQASVTCHALAVWSRPQQDGETINAGDDRYFRSLRTDELKLTIRDALAEVKHHIGRTTRDVRHRLLPAVLELHTRVRHGEWQKFLRSIGLNPATVRQWRRRERRATLELAWLLGDRPYIPVNGKNEAAIESAARQLAKAGQRLAQEVMRTTAGYPRCKYARQLAREYLKAYDDSSLSSELP